MLDRAAILERIDRAIAELQALREEVAAEERASDLLPAADDLAEHLLDVASASARSGYPPDTLRKWARTEGLGRKQGGRWLIRIDKLRERLNGK